MRFKLQTKDPLPPRTQEEGAVMFDTAALIGFTVTETPYADAPVDWFSLNTRMFMLDAFPCRSAIDRSA